jgi:2-polyprenyl-3-methyl-5-hydroxy-6-metoxy-1,4-benzoquinol methylase
VTSTLLELIESDEFAEAVGRRTAEPVASTLANIASEARLGLDLLSRAPVGPLRPGQRVLEVGAGSGVLASILRERGIDVTAVEPLIDGFTVFGAIRDELEQRFPGNLTTLQQRTAQSLDPDRDGLFDRIFSINVIEHCQPLDEALAGMARVLAPGGLMLHTCPNYRVPYEPHYRMPLLPVWPQATAALRPRLKNDPLWQSLNFVTPGDLRRFARRHGLTVRFMPGVFADVLTRLAADEAFARRQGWAGRIARGLARANVAGLVNRVPPAWLTPMVTVFARPA